MDAKRGGRARQIQALALVVGGLVLLGLGIVQEHLRYLNVLVGVLLMSVGVWVLVTAKQ